MAVYMITMIIGAAWGILNMVTYSKERSMFNMHVKIQGLFLMGLTFSLLIDRGVIV